MWNEDRKAWLALAWFRSFGSRTLKKLRHHYAENGVRAFRAARDELLQLGVTEYLSDMFIKWRSDVDPDAFVEQLTKEDIRFILPTDEEYPSFLLHSSDPPQHLFVRGATLHLVRPVAVVGTRSMTTYGANVTHRLVGDLVHGGCDIISGLALGIDAAAHVRALDAGGYTVAVLAGGINNRSIYPRHHLVLANRILERNGSIVSELPPGTESLKHLFPLRNRIIASLSTAVIVVEGADSSGSLLTAKLALDENRDVFAVPGPITSEQSSGTNRLIKLGATPYLDPNDILMLFDRTIQTLQYPPPVLTKDERHLLDILNRPLHIDEIIRALNTSSAAVLGRLAMLELNGCIESQGANIYARTPLGKQAAETASCSA